MRLEENRQSGNRFDPNPVDKLGRGRINHPSRITNVGGSRGVLRPEDKGICFRCGQEGHH